MLIQSIKVNYQSFIKKLLSERLVCIREPRRVLSYRATHVGTAAPVQPVNQLSTG